MKGLVSASLWAIALFAPLCLSGDTVTFAQFLEANPGGNDFSFSNSSTSAILQTKNPQTGANSVPVEFEWLSSIVGSLPADLQGPQAAQLSFYIQTTQPATLSGRFFEQNLYSQTAAGLPSYGTITFTRDTPDNELHKTNLLTVSFDAVSGGLTGIRRGATASLAADNNDNSSGQTDYVQFSSDYFHFSAQSEENLALSFTSASPCFTLYANVRQGRGGCVGTNSGFLSFLHSFTAAGTGTFASDPAPASVFLAPEPQAGWLTLVGVLFIGASLVSRTRRRCFSPKRN